MAVRPAITSSATRYPPSHRPTESAIGSQYVYLQSSTYKSSRSDTKTSMQELKRKRVSFAFILGFCKSSCHASSRTHSPYTLDSREFTAYMKLQAKITPIQTVSLSLV